MHDLEQYFMIQRRCSITVPYHTIMYQAEKHETNVLQNIENIQLYYKDVNISVINNESRDGKAI